MKEAGTIKNGSFSFSPSISLSYSLRYGSVDEYCFSSSEIDSKFVRRSFSVIFGSMILKVYAFVLLSVKRIID